MVPFRARLTSSHRRVVVTGLGVVSPIGCSVDEATDALETGRHGVRAMPEWSDMPDLQTRVAAPVVRPARFEEDRARAHAPAALFAVDASLQAVSAASLGRQGLASRRTGVAYGSTTGSSSAFERFYRPLVETRSIRGIDGSGYLEIFAHGPALHVASALGTEGRMIPASGACASGSLAIGLGLDAIRQGLSDVMIAGGADELHRATAAAFDMLMATSTHFNATPERTPRPFDVMRDGLVVGEGAGTLVLEALEHARARRAPVLAELVGWGTCCDGLHLTAPSTDGMRRAMELALEDAGVRSAEVDYVNGHGTGTELGDVAESEATRAAFGREVPFSATKGATGHTLGACGAIEAVFCVQMIRRGFLAPNRNLEQVDPRCAPLGWVRALERRAPRLVMSNNFAFGGINTSLVFRRMESERA